MAGFRQSLTFAFRYPLVRLGALSALGMVAATVATLAVLWWPAASALGQNERAVAQAKSKVLRAMDQAKIARQFDESHRRVEAIREKLEAAASQAELAAHINQLAAELGVRILNESNEEAKIKLGYQPIIQELSIEGSYAAIRQFLLAVRTLPTWTIVRELRLTRKNVAADLKAVVTLVTYRRTAG